MKDTMQNPTTLVLQPQAMTNSATVTARIDTVGYRQVSLKILRNTNASASAGPMLVNLLHSDDTVVTNFVTLAAQVSEAFNSSTPTVTRYEVDLKGKKRYLRLTVTSGTNGTHDNITISAAAELARPELTPSANSQLANGTVTVIAG